MRTKWLPTPAHFVLISIIITIILGTGLLALPIARYQNINFTDLLFTATSATCVTGLLTVPLSVFTTFGKIVILTLIQIGGLGLITLTLFLLSIFTEMGLAAQFMAGRFLEVDNWKHAKRILIFIIITTLVSELIGTAAIYWSIRNCYPLSKAIFYSIFHAISSFNNAGFTLFEGGVKFFSNNALFLATTGFLIFLGGFGFISLYELMRHYTKQKHSLYLSLQTKIILSLTFMIIAVSSLLFLLLEPNQLASCNQNWVHTFIEAIFNAVSCRNAGLTTFSIVALHKATLFLILIIAFIGAAPGSSGSGIKVTSFAIFLATLRSVMSGSLSVHIKGREIAPDQVLKSFCVITMSISWITFIVFCLLITEKASFFALFFETVSAFTTLGISLGITPYLSLIGKYLLICTMFIGRVGSLTLILALKKYQKPEFHYPQERIIIS